VLKKLRASYPQYDKSMTFVLIDWGTFAAHAVTTSKNIQRRSTLVLIKEGREIGRIVAQISEKKIKELLDKAL
jgi:thioredoxin 1